MGVFDYKVKLIVSEDYKEVGKYLSWNFSDETLTADTDSMKEARGRCYHKWNYCPVIWIPRRPNNSRAVATLAHEILHAVGHVTDWANIKYCNETEEIFTHMQAYILDWALKELEVKISWGNQ